MAKIYQTILLDSFNKFIRASETGKRLTKQNHRFSKGSLAQYRSVMSLICTWQQKNQSELLLQYSFRMTLSQVKKQRKAWKQFFRNFNLFLYRVRNCHDQYIASVWKIIRSFFHYMAKENQYDIRLVQGIFSMPAPVFTPLVLQPWQLQFLVKNREFDKSLPAHLRRTKDLLLFGSTVGLRFSDMMKLKKTDVIADPSGYILRVCTQKTGTEVSIPMAAWLLPIMKRYRKEAGRYLLPRLSNTNFNLQVKQVAERAGWTYLFPKYRQSRGRMIEMKNAAGKSLRFCDQVTAHTMRRTAITTLLMMGVPEQAVRRISGHSPGSREFYRYIALAEDYIHQHARKAFEKLMEEEN